MIRHICALAALIALSLTSVACVAENGTDESAEESEELAASRGAEFETFQGSDEHFYFNLVAANGEPILRSQAYASEDTAQSGVRAVLDNGTDARNYDVKKAESGQWFFNVKASNGEVIGTSQFYATKSNAERGGRTVRGIVRELRQKLRG
jgi:uncharacterized protein YegP (UPF0339 family)